VVPGIGSGRWELVGKMAAKADRFGAVDVREARADRSLRFSKRVWLPNKRIQLTSASVTPHAGHASRRPAEDGGRSRS
jgi:hypothetical protein